MTKTNAIRILEARGVPFQVVSYAYDPEDGGAVAAARALGVDPDIVYKTLVAVGDDREHVVFCIPAGSTLDRKKAASASGFRGVDLVPLRDLFGLTGYVRGGCSPVGMKKPFPVYIDEIAAVHAWILVNAGSRGLQLRIAPLDLGRAADAHFADLV